MQETLLSARVPVISTDLPTSFKVHVTRASNTIEIKLISTTNIFTFFLCTISPGDFSVTKREQGIKVDFQTFIKTLINYFHSVINNEMSAQAENFDSDKIKFMFIENDVFKNVVKLELVFYKPDEGEFKRYLGEMINRFETDNVRLIKELQLCKENLKTVERVSKEKIRTLESEYGNMKKEYDRVYKEKCVNEDEVEERRKEVTTLERKVLELERSSSEHKFEIERYRLNEMKIEKERENLEMLSDKVLHLEEDAREKERLIRRLRDEAKDLKSREREFEESRTARDAEKDRHRKDKDDAIKKMKSAERLLMEFKNENKRKDDEIGRLKRENDELVKRLENSQTVHNYLTKKKGNDSPNESQESSFFSSLHPETPPR